MAVHQSWLIENQIVLVRFWDDLTIEMIAEAFKTSGDFLRSAPGGKIHFLHDWTDLRSYPTNIKQLNSGNQANLTPELAQHLGWMVAYGKDDQMLRYLSSVLLQIVGIPFRLFPTRKDCLRYLCHMDQTLPLDAINL